MSTGLPNFPDSCLLADVGGTNARFAMLVQGIVHDVRVLDGARYPTIGDAAKAYLAGSKYPLPTMASLAIAAPLSGDEVRMTNHTWRFSVAALRRELNLQRLIVLNDFTALAMALRHIPNDELKQCGGGASQPNAAIALIGPGTGLGVSGLVPHGNHWIPLQGEGGHVTLPASNSREVQIIELMRSGLEHVSAERAISGPGLVNLYQAICALSRDTPRPLQPSEVAEAALTRVDPHCVEALDTFCALLGSVAGNLALTLGAFGGVYIGGGIVPRLGEYFMRSDFRTRFESKGRYKGYLAAIPVYVIASASPAFYGLARSFVDASPRLEDRS